MTWKSPKQDLCCCNIKDLCSRIKWCIVSPVLRNVVSILFLRKSLLYNCWMLRIPPAIFIFFFKLLLLIFFTLLADKFDIKYKTVKNKSFISISLLSLSILLLSLRQVVITSLIRFDIFCSVVGNSTLHSSLIK